MRRNWQGTGWYGFSLRLCSFAEAAEIPAESILSYSRMYLVMIRSLVMILKADQEEFQGIFD